MGTPVKDKQRQPCPLPNCGSSDAFHIYYDEKFGYYGKCYSCGGYKRMNTDYDHTPSPEPVAQPTGLKEHSLVPSSYRGISTDTFNKFGVEADIDYSTGAAQLKTIVFPYFNAGDIRSRICDKSDLLKFRQLNGKKSFVIDKVDSFSSEDMCLFGMHVFPKGSGRTVTVTEGEYDALSVYEMQGNYPVVSIPNGADSAIACLKNKANLEYLRSFEKIIVCFDQDAPGQEAAKKFANMFLGKAHIVEMDPALKDANGYLQSSQKEEFRKAWWAAHNSKPYTPGDIVLGRSMLNDVVFDEIEKYVPYPFQGLNELLYGMHTPEVVLVTAPPKVGKSLFTGALVNHLMKYDEKILVADISIEDTPKRRMKTLLSLHMKKALHRPEVRMGVDDDLAVESFKDLFGKDQYFGYDNFGAQSAQEVIDRIKYFVEVCGCKYVVLDHISFLASYHDQDERKALDQMSNQLAAMAVQQNFCLIEVAHLNREGKVHGSSNLEKTCFVHIDMFRDKDHEDPEVRNLVELRVKLNRRYGETGKCYVKFCNNPYQLVDVSKEEAARILGIEEVD